MAENISENDASKWMEKYADELSTEQFDRNDEVHNGQPRAIYGPMRKDSLIRKSSFHSDTQAGILYDSMLGANADSPIHASSMSDSIFEQSSFHADPPMCRTRRSESMIEPSSFHDLFVDSGHHDSFNVGSPISRSIDNGYNSGSNFTESPLSSDNRNSPPNRNSSFSSGCKVEMESPKMRMTDNVRFSGNRLDRSNSSGSNHSFSDNKPSPTIEQAIMMGCAPLQDPDRRERTTSMLSSPDSPPRYSEEAALEGLLQSLTVNHEADVIPPLNVMAPYMGVQVQYRDNNSSALEEAALLHRTAASINDAKYTWSGVLPTTTPKNASYSPKVFLGGVPWDITEQTLIHAFKPYGSVLVEWPGTNSFSGAIGGAAIQPRGYVYVLFEHEKQVKALLTACTHDFSNGNWYFKISSKKMRSKQVQVIPWIISDSNFVCSPSRRLEPQKTVFVGALHGMMTASALARVFEDLFGGVMYAGIDTDKYKYPIGSGRVTFSNHKSYMKAVAAAFVEIKAAKFSKKVQIDPYLEETICSSCGAGHGPYFCRDLTCFKYFCQSCWSWQHSMESLKHHRPLMRHTRVRY